MIDLAPRSIPTWLLPYECELATIGGYTTAPGTTESVPTFAKARFGIEIQALRGQEIRRSFGIEPFSEVTHVGTIENRAAAAQGDLVKLLNGPETGNHFRVDAVDNVRGHHIELLLAFANDATKDDVVGAI